MPEEQSATVRHYLRDNAFQEVPIAVCGLKGVGKGSLLRRHCQGFFSELTANDPTEDGLWRRQISMHDRPVMVQWVTHLGGPPTFDPRSEPATQPAAQHQPLPGDDAPLPSRAAAMMQQLVRDCDGCVFVYDVSNRASFEKLADIYEVVRGVLAAPASKAPKPAVVVANKTDLPRTAWEVAAAEGIRFAEQIGATFAEASAKLGSGVDEIAVEMANGVLLGRVMAQDSSR